MQEERIVVGQAELVVMRPADPESLIDESRFDDAEFLPYWAELWPSGVALARHVAGLDLRGVTALEVGCGLAVPSLAAALAGATVLATDWAKEAVELVAANAAANGLDVEAAVLDWADGRRVESERHDLVLAADVLYEERNAEPLLRLLDEVVAPRGEALIADPGRRHAAGFFTRAQTGGWEVERITVAALPAGGIMRLSRVGARPTARIRR